MTTIETIPMSDKLLNKVDTLHVPATDLKLSNGIILKYRPAKVAIPDKGGFQVIEWGSWKATDNLTVIATLDRTRHGTLLHVSCAYPKRDPGWGIIKAVRYAFFPADIDVAMMLPREKDYVNVHEHCFQIWQVPTIWGLR